MYAFIYLYFEKYYYTNDIKKIAVFYRQFSWKIAIITVVVSFKGLSR